MPISFWLAIVLAVVVLVSFGVAVGARSRDAKSLGWVTAAIAGVLVVVFTLTASANTVPVRNVGIVTSFNKPTGAVTGSGLQWTAPWQKVGEWDASNQKYDKIGDNRVRVRTSTLADAWVHLLVQWRVNAERAPEQFMAYKGDFEEFRGQRVGVQLDSAVNDAFTSYNPLEKIDVSTGNLNIDLKPYGESIRRYAVERLGDDVDILSVTVVRVDHDDKTENNIKAFQDKIAQTRNLEQDRKNAEIQKQITETNARVDKETRCLEIAEKVGANPGLCLNPGIVTGAK